jgi:hypothetical protein
MMAEKLDVWILENTDPQDRSMDWFHNYKLTVPAPLSDCRDKLIENLCALLEISEERTKKQKRGRRYEVAESGSVLFAKFNRKQAIARYAEITSHLGRTFVLFWKVDKGLIIETFSGTFQVHEEVPEKYRPSLALEKGELESRWQLKQLPVVKAITESDSIGDRGKTKGWVVELEQCGGTRSLDEVLRTPLCSVSVQNRRDLVYYRQFGWPFWRIKYRSLSFGAGKVKIEYYGRNVGKILRRLVVSEDKAEQVLQLYSDRKQWAYPGSIITDPEVQQVYDEVTAVPAEPEVQEVPAEAASGKG